MTEDWCRRTLIFFQSALVIFSNVANTDPVRCGRLAEIRHDARMAPKRLHKAPRFLAY